MEKIEFKEGIHKWRRRGFYSEAMLVKILEKSGYKAVRVPVSNLSLNPLPDVIARHDWEKNKLPEQTRVLKRDKDNFDLKKGEKK